jgi:hypothetical protein
MTDWQLDRRMTAAQYRAAIDRLGLNMSQAGRFLGVSPSTAQRYAKGKGEIPECIALLLGLMVQFKIEPMVPRNWRP